jgi:hypothetical protein
MTEAEWLGATDPAVKLSALRGTSSARKLRLFCCACCRRVWNAMADDGRRAVEAAERDADQPPADADPLDGRVIDPVAGGPRHGTIYAAECAADAAVTAPDPKAEGAAQCALLADIFGNPFRPVALDPSWLTSAVVALATGIYADRASDRLPILADALQDAGCDNADVLDHCRGDGRHVRGCWVVDLLLGKE